MMKRNTFAALTAALISMSFAGALSTPAMASVTTGADIQQQARMDVRMAQSNLKHHDPDAALSETANAETALLNAQDAGLYRNKAALDALKSAHGDLLKKEAAAAGNSLRSAGKDLAS